MFCVYGIWVRREVSYGLGIGLIGEASCVWGIGMRVEVSCAFGNWAMRRSILCLGN